MSQATNSLKVLSRIWGNREGYVFLPWINGDAKDKDDRKAKYHEGRAFDWPKEKEAILSHMEKHTDDDLYFCPNLFLKKRRAGFVSIEEKALWADLDEVNPEHIEDDLRPTMAWESSPGRYQAIWLLTEEAILASEAGGLNQRLTYYLGADLGGWDSTQLLRPPGWKNHKPEYRERYGDPVQGKLLWGTGPRYGSGELEEILPKLTASVPESEEVLEQEIEAVNRHQVMARIRNKLPVEAKRVLRAQETDGDRSEKLFFLELSLAEVGCTAAEIIAIVRETVWNKFAGRNDELKRLKVEASKAIEKTRQKEEVEGGDFEIAEDIKEPQNLWDLVLNIPEPKWLIEQLWNQEAVGIIAGGPKSMKSWFSLDMAISIATGNDCLGQFKVSEPGPVLWIQEEDSLHEIKRRLRLITNGRDDLGQYHPDICMTKNEEGQLEWGPVNKPPLNALIRQGLMLSDPEVQEWLDEQLSKIPYKALFLDPLMQLHDAKENQYGEIMIRFLKPLRDLAYKHSLAVFLIHHTGKAEKGDRRQGSRLLGTQAIHAWTEDLLVMDKDERTGDITMFRESKSAGEDEFHFRSVFTPSGRTKNGRKRKSRLWYAKPVERKDEDRERKGPKKEENGGDLKLRKSFQALEELGAGAHSTKQIAEHMGISSNGAYRQLARLKDNGVVTSNGKGWEIIA